MKFTIPNFRKKPIQTVEIVKPTLNERVDAVVEDKTSLAVRTAVNELKETVEQYKPHIIIGAVAAVAVLGYFLRPKVVVNVYLA